MGIFFGFGDKKEKNVSWHATATRHHWRKPVQILGWLVFCAQLMRLSLSLSLWWAKHYLPRWSNHLRWKAMTILHYLLRVPANTFTRQGTFLKGCMILAPRFSIGASFAQPFMFSAESYPVDRDWLHPSTIHSDSCCSCKSQWGFKRNEAWFHPKFCRARMIIEMSLLLLWAGYALLLQIFATFCFWQLGFPRKRHIAKENTKWAPLVLSLESTGVRHQKSEVSSLYLAPFFGHSSPLLPSFLPFSVPPLVLSQTQSDCTKAQIYSTGWSIWWRGGTMFDEMKLKVLSQYKLHILRCVNFWVMLWK